MLKCAVHGCAVTELEMPLDCRLVRFPDDCRQIIWIERTKGYGSTWTPQSDSRICTLHFEVRHFFGNKKKGRLLKGAIPTANLPKFPFSVPQSPSLPSTLSKPSLSSSSVSTSSNAPVPNDQLSSISRKSIELQENCNSGEKPQLQPKSTSVSDILDFLKFEEDDYLNKILLKKSIRGLIFHVDDLCKRNQNNPTKEMELKSMSFILHKMQRNMGISPDEALLVFQEQVHENIYISLKRFVKVEKKQFKALLRSFSLSLHFYSQPAYNFIRQKLNGALPHPRTIQAWYTTIDKYIF